MGGGKHPEHEGEADHNADEPRRRDQIEAARQQVEEALRRSGSGAGLAREVEAEPAPSLAPDAFPGYEIVREIHRGGQGIVYLAIQRSTQRQVALKVLREHLFPNPQEKVRFEREAHILGQLDHPDIVAVHDSGSAGGHSFLVMDYVEGQALDAYIAETQPSVRKVLGLFAEICEAVNAAHLRGVIHRDLKPSNIRIDEQGRPHILDFGLAKMTAGEAQGPMATVTGQFMGSLPWAAPEQAEAVPSRIDTRTDVYALGVILYQVLTDRFPYEVLGNIRDVLDRIMRAEPARPSTLCREIDDEVETIVLKCLAKEQDRRYQTAGELARDVRHYLSGEPIEAKRDSAGYILRKQLRRYRVHLAIAAAFTIFVTVSLVVTFTLWRRAAGAQAEAQNQARTAQQTLAFLSDDVFGAMDTMRVGRHRSLESALDEAARKLDTRLADAPLVQASVCDALATMYAGLLTQSDKERSMLEKALRLRRQALGDDHADVAASQWRMGHRLVSEDKEAAEPLLRSALATYRRRYGNDDVRVAEFKRGLGEFLWLHRGSLEEGRRLIGDALAFHRRRFGNEHPEVAADLEALAGLYYAQDQYKEAVRFRSEALEILRNTLGDHPRTSSCLQNLAEPYRVLGEMALAEKCQREALAMSRRLYGDGHLEVADRQYVLGFLLCGKGDCSEGEELLRQAVELRARLWPSTPDANMLACLAGCLIKQHKYAEAEPYVRQTLEIYQDRQAHDWPIYRTMSQLGVILTHKGAFAEAEDLLLKAHQGLKADPGATDRLRDRVIDDIIRLYEAWGKPDQAATWSERKSELVRQPP